MQVQSECPHPCVEWLASNPPLVEQQIMGWQQWDGPWSLVVQLQQQQKMHYLYMRPCWEDTQMIDYILSL
jgi:hypothetical protein